MSSATSKTLRSSRSGTTLGFSDKAKLDEGSIWPVVYALKALTVAEEAKITSLVKKAVGSV